MDGENLNKTNGTGVASTKGLTGLVLIYTFSWAFAALDRLIIAFMLPFIMPYFGMNYAQAGLLMSLMAIGLLVCALIFGPLSDKIGRKKITLPMLLIFSCLSCVTGLVKSIALLFVVRTIVGGSEGAFNTAAPAHISEVSPPEKRGGYIGTYLSSFAIGGAFLAPIYAMNVASRWSWQTACYLTIIPGVILAILGWIFIKESPRFVKGTPEYDAEQEAKKQDQGKVGLIEVLKIRNVVLSLVLVAVFFVWCWSWLSYGTSYFTAEKGFDEITSGNLMGIFGLGAFFGCLVMPRLSDRYGRKPVILITSAISFVVVAILLFLPHGFADYAVLLFLSTFFAWGALPLFMMVIPTESVKPGWAASAIAIALGVGEVIGMAAQPVLGAIADASNLTNAMFVGSFGLVAGCIVCLFLKESAPAVLARRAEKAKEQA